MIVEAGLYRGSGGDDRLESSLKVTLANVWSPRKLLVVCERVHLIPHNVFSTYFQRVTLATYVRLVRSFGFLFVPRSGRRRLI